MKKEEKMKLRKALSELDYEYCEENPKIERVGEYEVCFISYSKVEECCSKCFLNKQKDCLPCRSWERETEDNGYYRYYSKRQEFDVTERRKQSNIFRMKNKEKGVYDDE